jgi:fucose permease
MQSIATSLGVNDKNKRLMYVMYFAFFCSGMMSQIFGAILPFLQEEYHLSYTFRGLLLSAHQTGNLLAVFIAGYLPYAIGRKRSTLYLSSGKAVGLFLMILTGNPILLVLAFLLTGIGRGTLSNITNVVTAEISTKKTSALNVLHSSFAVGAFISPLIVMLITKGSPSLWWVGVALIVEMEIFSLGAIDTSNLSDTPAIKSQDQGRGYYKDARWWVNTGILFFYLCNESSIMGWLITYFKETGRLSPTIAQISSSLLWLMILAGRLGCAAISGKVNKSTLLLVLGLGQTTCFLVMISSPSKALTLAAIFLLGLFMSATYPTTLGTMPNRYNSSTVATGNCIAIASIGGIIMPIIVGAVAEQTGIGGGIATISIALFCMVILMIAKRIMGQKQEE